MDKSYYVLMAILSKISAYLKATYKAREIVDDKQKQICDEIIFVLNDIFHAGFEIGEEVAEREATTFKAYKE